MLKIITTVLLFFTSIQCFAMHWDSPIDKKYQAKNPQLFAKFNQARDLLDRWAGQQSQLTQADQLLKNILAHDQSFSPAYREYGRLFIMAGYVKNEQFKPGSLNPAETSILKSLEIEPDYADAYVLLGHLYTQMKRYSEAEEALKKGEEIGTETPWLALNWADLLRRQRDYAGAMSRYQSVVDQGTPNVKAYAAALSGVTKMHKTMRNYDKANEGYLAQIEFRPNDAWTWGNYSSFLLFRYKDVDGAIEKGEQALRLMDYGMGRFILACSLYTKWAYLKDSPESEKQELAQAAFDRAQEIYPYTDKVIKRTKKYAHTRITATALEEWTVSNR